MDSISLDLNAYIQQMADLTFIDMMSLLSGDEDDSKLMKGVLNIFYKNGVRPDVAMKILSDLIPLFENNEETEND